MNKLYRYFSALVLGAFGKRIVCSPPPDETLVQPAKMVRAYRVGGLTFGHYQSNSEEPPDHITTQHLRARSHHKDDVEQLSWTVAPATPEHIAACHPDDRFAESEHLVALSDAAGSILLFAFMTEREAEMTMDAAERAGCPSLTDHGRNPLSPDSGEFITDYALTREEVRLLALHWSEQYLNYASWCVHNDAGGTTELLFRDYATSRLVHAQAVLGPAGFKAIEQEAQIRVLEKLQQESRDSDYDEPGWCGGEDWEQLDPETD